MDHPKFDIPLVVLASIILLGAGAGIGAFAFVYGKGASYLTDDPAACANCHVMRDQYEGWARSPHRGVAVCNSCHAPSALIAKYVTKGINGFNHSWAFTTGRMREPIRIRPWNARIAVDNCVRCHQGLFDGPRSAHARVDDEANCLSCHRQVGHSY